MARYDNREFNREIKSLYNAWSKVDSQIELPASLTGDALLPLISGVPVPRAPEKGGRRQIQFSPRVFSWKSVSTYAAALVLIVALSALISRGPSDIQEGSIDIADPERGVSDLENPLDPRGIEPDLPDATVGDGFASEEPLAQPWQGDTPESGDDPASAPGNAAVSGDAAALEGEAPVGGLSGSTILYENDVFTYTWRPNDVNDPDKAGYPLMVNVIDKSTEELAFSFDIASIQSVEQSLLYENTLCLFGPSALGDDELVLLVYDLSRPGYPDNVLEHSVAGSLINSRLYRNVLNYVLHMPAGTDPGCEITVLPNSTGEDLCVVVAVDLDTMQVEQKAFAGAGRAVSLYNLNAYLDYEGEVTEENPEGHYVAHIRLDGMDIELRAEE